jgi:hypothetical protein
MIDKHALMKRLEREGRWPEAAEWKNKRIKEHRAAGLLRPEASDSAWSEMEKEFPPLPAPEPPIDILQGRTPQQFVEDCQREWDAAPTIETEVPWTDLPDDVGFDDDQDWAVQNFLFIVARVVEVGRQYWEIDWSRAVTPAPSMLAIDLVRQMMDEPDDFEKRLKMRAVSRRPE